MVGQVSSLLNHQNVKFGVYIYIYGIDFQSLPALSIAHVEPPDFFSQSRHSKKGKSVLSSFFFWQLLSDHIWSMGNCSINSKKKKTTISTYRQDAIQGSLPSPPFRDWIPPTHRRHIHGWVQLEAPAAEGPCSRARAHWVTASAQGAPPQPSPEAPAAVSDSAASIPKAGQTQSLKGGKQRIGVIWRCWPYSFRGGQRSCKLDMSILRWGDFGWQKVCLEFLFIAKDFVLARSKKF